jgi:hypothetical protein
MRGKLVGWEKRKEERKKGKTILHKKEAGRVKGRKARLLWMRGKLVG